MYVDAINLAKHVGLRNVDINFLGLCEVNWCELSCVCVGVSELVRKSCCHVHSTNPPASQQHAAVTPFP